MKSGYVALTTVLVLMVVIVAVSFTVVTSSVTELQTSWSDVGSALALEKAESCAEEALLKLNDTAEIPETINFPSYSCPISVISHIDNDWDFTVTAVYSTYTSVIRINATRSDKVYINNWRQI